MLTKDQAIKDARVKIMGKTSSGCCGIEKTGMKIGDIGVICLLTGELYTRGKGGSIWVRKEQGSKKEYSFQPEDLELLEEDSK